MLTARPIMENNARFVFNEIPPGSAMVFPAGSIHFEMNNGCGVYPVLGPPHLTLNKFLLQRI